MHRRKPGGLWLASFPAPLPQPQRRYLSREPRSRLPWRETPASRGERSSISTRTGSPQAALCHFALQRGRPRAEPGVQLPEGILNKKWDPLVCLSLGKSCWCFPVVCPWWMVLNLDPDSSLCSNFSCHWISMAIESKCKVWTQQHWRQTGLERRFKSTQLGKGSVWKWLREAGIWLVWLKREKFYHSEHPAASSTVLTQEMLSGLKNKWSPGRSCSPT